MKGIPRTRSFKYASGIFEVAITKTIFVLVARQVPPRAPNLWLRFVLDKQAYLLVYFQLDVWRQFSR
jgi:hypothetical protein